MNEPTSGNRSVSVISFEETAELDAALSKSRDSQSSIFFSPENVGLGEGFRLESNFSSFLKRFLVRT